MIELVKKTASPEYLESAAFNIAVINSHENIHSLLGAGIGLSGEVGEFNEIIKKHVWQGRKFDEVKAKKELGDIYWYFALACIALDTTPDEIAKIVTEKLLTRYSETAGQFNLKQSENRKPDDN